MRAAFLLALLVLLPGCAPSSMYQWNNYDSRLLRYYRDPTSAENFRVTMEGHLKAVEDEKLRPAPGLYAELGTLYLERGDRTTAMRYYTKERETWPESRYVMDALLKNLQRASEREAELKKQQ